MRGGLFPKFRFEVAAKKKKRDEKKNYLLVGENNSPCVFMWALHHASYTLA